MKRHEPVGTSVRRSLDTKRLAEALTMAGIDPRLWCSHGIVATVDSDEDGNPVPDPTDWRAIWNGPSGIEVDVYLEPSRIPVTCHYGVGAGGRSAQVKTPIRPGDCVIVCLPGGDATDGPVIVAVTNTDAHAVPTGADRLPVWRNDSVFVWAEDVPIDIRTKGGARIQVNQDGTVVANEGSKGVARIQDAVQVTLSGLLAPVGGTTPPEALAAAAAISGLYRLAAALVATGLFPGAPAPINPVPPAPDVSIPGTITAASATVKAGD